MVELREQWTLEECGGSIAVHNVEKWLHSLAHSQSEYVRALKQAVSDEPAVIVWRATEVQMATERISVIEWLRNLNRQRGR